jgi:hypothetical protein
MQVLVLAHRYRYDRRTNPDNKVSYHAQWQSGAQLQYFP